ncbi:fimbrillin family protein [Parasphaerochaeta coccoides]|uniref:Regulator of chromosome condensation RCC1 n=1 Tax=Parasphaerochaeta coccoides (strain ATCC BAA-1237 / DSM 17374 / SPN1) TaxID=760011 RepID=F4GJR2_PARC1|nr:regulator of chromosome condensation RCC1 [Parasphaerochaeta coccoides DSM 17374]
MRERERERERESRESKLSVMVFLTILMLLITFISCDNKLNVSHTNAVRFSTEIGRKATANSEWQADDEVGIYMLEHGTGTAATTAPERANRHYTADTASQTSGFTPATTADTLKWNDIAANANDTFDFIAYYPWAYLAHTEDGAGTTSFYDTDTLYIDINRDRGTHEQDTGKADVLWGRTDTVQNNTSTVHLKLDHMLSRLIVNIAPSTTVDAVAINDATAFVATVKGLDNITTMSLDDGSLADVSGLAAPIAMKDISDTLTTTERAEGKRRFEAVLIPVGNTDALANVSLEFTLSGGARAGTYTWKPSTTGAVAEGDKHLIHFDKGKQHVYNMTLNTDDEEVAVASIQIEIGEWDEGDGINGAATFKPYRAVSAGSNHTMILKNNGTLWATGWNNTGQLGDSTTDDRNTPEQVWDSTDGSVRMADVAAVSTGPGHTMILKKDGTLWATGLNEYGQLGDGTMTTIRTPPVQVKASTDDNDFMTDVAAVSAGLYHTTILKKDGTLWATGYNNDGQLGVGAVATYTTSIPVQVKGSGGVGFMTDVAAVSTKQNHTMILKKDGTLWATGYNYYGQLGDGTTTRRTTPVRVKASIAENDFMTDVAAVSAGSWHTMILKKDGTLWATGFNNYGQLGVGDTTDRSTPVQVWDSTDGSMKMTNVAAVYAGMGHTMILKKDGTLWATGNNANGQLGIGDTPAQISIPVQVKGANGVGFMTDVAAVSVGIYHTMILKKDGTLWATGRNNYGQLGLGNITIRRTPVQVIF